LGGFAQIGPGLIRANPPNPRSSAFHFPLATPPTRISGLPDLATFGSYRQYLMDGNFAQNEKKRLTFENGGST
jgi:hypothetical protein